MSASRRHTLKSKHGKTKPSREIRISDWVLMCSDHFRTAFLRALSSWHTYQSAVASMPHSTPLAACPSRPPRRTASTCRHRGWRIHRTRLTRCESQMANFAVVHNTA
jgi:hypothetical protein